MDFLYDFLKRYWSIVLNAILLGLLILTTSYLFLQNDNNKSEVIEEVLVTEEVILNEESNSFYVDLKGAVKKPGVYEMDSGSIINDAIKKAGGFTSKAYKDNINLSKKLTPEMVLYVYSKSEYTKLNDDSKVEPITCKCEEIYIDSCTNVGSSVITPDDSTSSDDIIVSDDNVENAEIKDTKVSINNASKEELMTLNGIGESKAISIIKYREENGSFKSLEELKNVSGIGDAAYEKIKDYIKL